MNDMPIRELLRGLPRQSASPRFTTEVLRAVRRSRPERPQAWRLAAAFALAACLIAAVQLAVINHTNQERTAALRAEKQRIAAELREVKQFANDYEPVLFLERNDGTRVVVEHEQGSTAAVPAVQIID